LPFRHLETDNLLISGMSGSPNPNSAKQFVLALVVVLGGVVLGSFIVMKKEEPGRTQRPFPPPITQTPGRSANHADTGTNEMVWIPGATFLMGSESGKSDEQPVHSVTVRGFWMDKTEVTNEQFEKFVRATGYVTVAERKPDPKDFPDASPEMLVPGSVVFNPPPGEVPLDNHYIWWKWLPGANWRHPEGPDTDIKDRIKHPVVHVCWDDAMAYCNLAD